VQERLTRQIAEAVQGQTGASAVGVVLECRHMCMCVRGVEEPASCTQTQTLLGQFKTDPHARAEFLQAALRR